MLNSNLKNAYMKSAQSFDNGSETPKSAKNKSMSNYSNQSKPCFSDSSSYSSNNISMVSIRRDNQYKNLRQQYVELRKKIIEQMVDSNKRMDFKQFKSWLNKYSFIRQYFRESLNPALWTWHVEDQEKTSIQLQLHLMNMNDVGYKPEKSMKIREAILQKQGKRTKLMFDRYYVIRDNAILQYNSVDQRLPCRITPLGGLYI